MLKNRLMRLMRDNRGRGAFRAEASSGTLWIHDFIVASEADAEWFGGVAGEAVVKALDQMQGPVSVRINSPGGDVFGGMAIYHALKAYDRGPVTVLIEGMAASIASVIAMGGDQIQLGGPGAMMMIHKSWTIMMGHADALRDEAGVLDKIDAAMVAIYAARSGQPPETFEAMLARGDSWMNAAEVMALGLADGVAGEPVAPETGGETEPGSAPKSAPGARAASTVPVWDLSAYAPDPGPEPEPEPVPERVPVTARGYLDVIAEREVQVARDRERDRDRDRDRARAALVRTA